MKIKFFVLLLFAAQAVLSQGKPAQSSEANEIKINRFISGTLVTSNNEDNSALVILIQGSGPTDRNGNQAFMKNDAFKKLANELSEKGIASFRYDKRILAMDQLGISEEQIRFDDFITDASSVLNHFQEQDMFRKIVVLGHSQGSLVGMLASKNNADAFISVSGAGQPIDSVIVSQIGQQMPGLEISARSSFKELRNSGSTNSYNPGLASIFRPQLQPFMLSWMQYNPAEEIKKLEMPILIINGSKDLQVSEQEAQKLKMAQPKAQLVNLKNMNHVLREIEGGDLENQKSYNESRRPLHPDLVPTIEEFIKGL